MHKKTLYRLSLPALLLPFFLSIPAQAQGDRVLAQVADGTGGDGTQFITKFRITNLGPDQSTEIKKLKVMFFLQNGTPWTISTNLGTGPASEFPLDIGSYQTIALNTSGTASTLTTGYAIVRNTDAQTIYAEDYEVAVTAFYEVRKGGAVIDTISVPVSQPTVSFVLPVEMDSSNNLLTGFAIVNLAGIANAVTMQLFPATTPSSGEAPAGESQKITLASNEQRATFLQQIFSSAGSFKGALVGSSEKPVAILALLQSPTPNGLQYATMVPAYIDALRRNTNMYLRLGLALDADLPVSDYFNNDKDTTPWDVLFEKQTDTTRRLTPQSGAQLAVIGQKLDADFDALTIQDLQGMSYSTNPIDMSDNSTNLTPTNSSLGFFSFAIKTGLGRYAKVRVTEVISYTSSPDKDLVLEIFVFK